LVLKSRLARGDYEVTAEAMARARFDIEWTAGLVVAAKGSVNAAERALSVVLAEHEPLLAEWVAKAIKANGWDFGLFAVPVNMGRPAPDAKGPSVWLSQDKPQTADPIGVPSGSVNLVVVTPGGEHIEDARTIISGAQALARTWQGRASAPGTRRMGGSLTSFSSHSRQALGIRCPTVPPTDPRAAARRQDCGSRS
jgi:hypothetical protein